MIAGSVAAVTSSAAQASQSCGTRTYPAILYRPVKLLKKELGERFEFIDRTTLASIIERRGGFPLMVAGKIVGAIVAAGVPARKVFRTMRWYTPLTGWPTLISRRKAPAKSAVCSHELGGAWPSPEGNMGRYTQVGRRGFAKRHAGNDF